MKNITTITITLAVFCLFSFQKYNTADVCHSTFSLKTQHVPYTKAQIDKFIREVFAEHADELVFNSTSARLELITGFLNRVSVQFKPEYTGKKFALLSELKLQNKYNNLLQKDVGVIFRPSDFNPLKYNFPMDSKAMMIYRVDNTDYLVIIDPVR